MKKIIFLLCLSFFSFSFAQEENKVPRLLHGVWMNPSRYIVFDTGYSKDNGSIPMIVLRSFYGRYDDRAAESHDYTEKNKRPLNDATQRDLPEEIVYKFIPLTPELIPNKVVKQEDGDEILADGISSGAWTLQVKYPRRKEIYNIPFAVIGNKLYLNFLVKEEDSDKLAKNSFLDGNIMQSGNPLNGYWQDNGNAIGLLVSPAKNSNELMSYYIIDDDFYCIRYWKTDMEYGKDAKAFFSDEKETYSVPKHLKVSDSVFTCVNGRGSKIRNIKKSNKFDSEYSLNSILVKKNGTDENGNDFSYSVRTSTICAIGKPYLELVEGKTIEQIIKEDSEKEYPKPEPLFPPHGVLDFDWSIIEDPPKNWNMRMLDLGK